MSNYIKQNFENDQVLKAEQLNYIEDGIERAAKGTSSLSPSSTLKDSLVSCSPLENSLLEVTSCIEAAQEGSGDPYPAGGKNLLPYPYYQPEGTVTVGGMNFEIRKDGSILVKAGTTSDTTAGITLNYKFLNFIAGKTYYVSGTKIPIYVYISYKDETDQMRYSSDSFVWQENYTFNSIFIQINKNITISSDTIIYPALYVDKKEDIWTPYSNIRPITGWDAVTMTRCGKNLIDVSGEAVELIGLKCVYDNQKMLINGTSTSSGGRLNFKTKPVKLKCGTYTASIIFEGATGAANVKAALQTKNTSIAQFTSKYTFTVETETEYTIGLNFTNGATFDFNARIMVEVGENATDYEPYKEAQTYTAQFPETIYGGVMDWKTGELMVTHAKYEITGNEGWTKNSKFPNINRFEVSIRDVPLNAGGINEFDNNIISSHNKVSDSLNKEGMYVTNVAGGRLGLRWIDETFKIESVEVFIEFLKTQYNTGTPVTIVYQIAEPYTIQLTPQQIEILKGTNNLFSTTGKTKVTFQTDLTQTLNNQTLDLNDLGARIARLETALINTL